MQFDEKPLQALQTRCDGLKYAHVQLIETMEPKKRSFGVLAALSKSLRGLVGKSSRRPAEGAAPAQKQRAFGTRSARANKPTLGTRCAERDLWPKPASPLALQVACSRWQACQRKKSSSSSLVLMQHRQPPQPPAQPSMQQQQQPLRASPPPGQPQHPYPRPAQPAASARPGCLQSNSAALPPQPPA